MRYIVDGIEYPSYEEAIKACWLFVEDHYYWIAKSFITIYD